MQSNSIFSKEKNETIEVRELSKENLTYDEYLKIALGNDSTTIGKAFPPLVHNTVLSSNFTLNPPNGRMVINLNGESEYVIDGKLETLEETSIQEKQTDFEREMSLNIR